MPGQNVVIVESPAKAKTINKYLGKDYTVVASYGHVRDLPAKDGSVRPEEDFAMDWELGDRAKRHVEDIAKAAKGAQTIFLATDPDREGEAISWHVREVLRAKRGLKDLDFRRVTFNEITRGAVLDAIANPRNLNAELIEAYLARRALDYLVGFTLSPVLWRKLPGSRSAGRVQSVALRLICEREAEIEEFRPREFWTIEAVFETADGAAIHARLTHVDGKKLDKFDLTDEAQAKALVERLSGLDYAVGNVERKQVRRNPYAPFTTSTLQQEASRKLGFSATQTMRTAQRLYEGVEMDGDTVGLITYMRTDGLQLAGEAIEGARSLIAGQFGGNYLPASPRIYKSTAKNAQEAHEAIRPTDLSRRPIDVSRSLGSAELKLYELIWKRTIACQMSSAVLDQVAVDISALSGAATFRATGSIVVFDGFLKVYEEGRDDPGEGDDNSQRKLPPVAAGDPVRRTATTPNQHFTQPPPRYSEASLVKRLEELGIGRPSTYASILQVLQDRDYVRLDRRRFVPENRGRLVTTFLTNFFERYVRYDFTAELENQLDDISGGRIDWKSVLSAFWRDFSGAVDGARDLTITQVIDALDEALGPHFFPPRSEGTDPRRCPSCGTGRLGLRLSRSGAFLGCSNYPDCRYTRPMAVPGDGEDAAAEAFPRELGSVSEGGEPVSVRKGPFGYYVQRGNGEGDAKPLRVSLPKTMSPLEVDLPTALALLALPREVGRHNESGQPILAGIGRYGPYLKIGNAYRNLPADEDVLTIGINRATELLADAKPRAAAEPLRTLGEHSDGQPVAVYKGRFGPYIRHGRIMASLPKALEVDDLTLDRAIELLEAKAAKSGKGGKAAKGKAKTSGSAKKTTKAASRTAKAETGKTAQSRGAERSTNGAVKAKTPPRTKDAGSKAASSPTKKSRRPQSKTASSRSGGTASRGDD